MSKCKKHPRYKALKPPKVACEDCWVLYLGMSEACRNGGCVCPEEPSTPDESDELEAEHARQCQAAYDAGVRDGHESGFEEGKRWEP